MKAEYCLKIHSPGTAKIYIDAGGNIFQNLANKYYIILLGRNNPQYKKVGIFAFDKRGFESHGELVRNREEMERSLERIG